MTLEEIIQGCQEDNSIAQKLLYNHYISTLYRLSIRYVRVVADAEDCTSEAFVKIFEKLPSFDFRDKNSVEVWMKQIVINQSLMCLRRRGSFQLVGLEDAPDIQAFSTTEEAVDSKEILKLLLHLPDGYRTVFNLYAIEGFTHAEIATMLSISENTSKTQLFKARQLLQKLLSTQLGIKR